MRPGRKTLTETKEISLTPCKTNKSGYRWVSWCKHANRWVAKVKIANVQRHIGYFTDAAEAHAEALKYVQEQRAKAQGQP